MPSVRRKFFVRHPMVVDVGCSCRRTLPSLFSCSTKTPTPLSPSITTSHWGTSFTATTTTTATATAADSSSPSRCFDYVSSPSSGFYAPEAPKKVAAGQRKLNKKTNKATDTATRKGVVEGSVAVVKDSSDPYLDFHDSMLQMIVEMDIYAWDDLRDLLHRFLALNAERHHHLVLRAFAEIWNGIFSPAAPSLPSSSTSAACRGRGRRRR